MSERFWLVLHDPGCVPALKGPWLARDSAKVLREFMLARPGALIDYVTIGHDGPSVEHGPQVLQMLDGRSMTFARRHNQRVAQAFARRA